MRLRRVRWKSLPLMSCALVCLALPIPRATAQPLAKNKAVEPTERRVFIPYRNWNTLLKLDDPTIFLPLSQYRDLLKQAAKGQAAGTTGPMVSAVITEAHYTASVEKDYARITAELTVRSLVEGWSEVPLNFGNAAIGKMTGADGKALLRGTGVGKYSLMLPSKGTHKITLELSAKVTTSPGGREVQFGCPRVGISTFQLTVPQANQSISITPQLIALPAAAVANKTRVKAGLGATTQIAARWNPKVAAVPQMQRLATVTNLTRINVQSDLISHETQLTFDVLRGELKQLQFVVPLDHRILDVSGPAAKIVGWTSEKQPKRQVVTVNLSEPLTGRITLTANTERTLAGETFSTGGVAEDGTASGVHAIGVARENGFLVLNHDESIALSIARQTGWAQARQEDVPASHRRANSSYYRFFGTKSPLKIDVHLVKPRIVVRQNASYAFAEDDLQIVAIVEYQIERIGVFALQWKVPDGLEIDNVSAAGMKTFRLDPADRTLTIEFDKKIKGRHNVTIHGHTKRAADDMGKAFDLPLLSPVSVERDYGQLRLYAPSSLAVILDQTQAPGIVPSKKIEGAAPQGMRLVSAWDYQQRPARIPVRLERVPPRITARIGTTIDARQTATNVSTRLEYTVEHSPVALFRFLVPKSSTEGLRVRDQADQAIPFRLTEPKAPKKPPAKKPAKKPAKVEAPQPPDLSEWMLVTIELPKPVIGRQTFVVDYEIAATTANGKEAAARELSIQPLRAIVSAVVAGDALVPAVSELNGEIAVGGVREFKTQSSAEGDDVERIDSREVEFVAKGNGEFFRYHKEPVTANITVVKLDIEEVVETVVSKALVEVLIDRDKIATYRCRYRLVSSERQRLRVDLPKTAEPLAMIVDGKKVDLELIAGGKEEDEFRGYLLNISHEETSDRPFTLVLQFRVSLDPPPFEDNLRRLKLFLPQIGGGTESRAVVQQLRTVLWVPREFALVGETDKFHRQTWTQLTGIFPDQFAADTTADAHEDWIGVEPGGFDFPTQGHSYRFDNLGGATQIEVTYANVAFATWLLSIPLLLIGWVLAKTTWENKLGVLLLVAFAATLLALRDIDWVYHGLFMARYGIAVMMAWWLIHAIFSLRSGWPRSAMSSSSSGGPPVAIYSNMATAVIPPPGVFDEVNRRIRKPPESTE